ncbi:MAG: sigma 54-interacting transcriptional regulator [Candidatus Wallbacteria bacterium]|nr:sigma 54-interacting transcriptional regulator [Candidatus Wallbacteria bacterium]
MEQKILICSLLESQSAAASYIAMQRFQDSELVLTSVPGFPAKILEILSTLKTSSHFFFLGAEVFYNLKEFQAVIEAAVTSGHQITWLNNRHDLSFFQSRTGPNFRLLENKLSLPQMMAEKFEVDSESVRKYLAWQEKKSQLIFPGLLYFTILHSHYKKENDIVGQLELFESLPASFINLDFVHSQYQINCMNLFLLARGGCFLKLKELILKYGTNQGNVLINGEKGTGVETAAFLIHYCSRRTGRPFLEIFCAGLDEEQLEMELFGLEGFSGTQNKPGILEKANGGTVFLQDIDKVPARLQKKILDFLDERSFRRVGGVKKINTDVRIISSAENALPEDFDGNGLRQDLYYGITDTILEIPSLRQSPDDIIAIAEDISYRLAEELKLDAVNFDENARQYLTSGKWPGNIRQLTRHLKMAYFSNHWKWEMKGEKYEGRLQKTTGDSKADFSEYDLKLSMEQHKLEIIRRYYQKFGSNKAQTAKALDITLNTLKSALKKIGLS